MEIIYLLLAVAVIILANAVPIWFFSKLDKKVSKEASDKYREDSFWKSLGVDMPENKVVFMVPLGKPSLYQGIKQRLRIRRMD